MTTADVYTSELRYRRLFEAAHDGIIIVDAATRKIIDVNPFLEGFLGYTRADFIGKELFEIGLLKDESASQIAFQLLQSKGHIRYEDLPLRTKDGRRVDVEFVSNVYQEGKQQVIQCNVRDITARKQTENALRESEERFKLVARAVSDVIWDWDLIADTVWWSEGFTKTFGYFPQEVESGISFWTNRIHPDERRRVVDGIHHNINTDEEGWTAEYRFRCKNDSYAFVRDNGHIIRNAEGKGIRMVGGMRDLTEQKKMEAQYLRAQRVENIGSLASGIAHDLNNVLTPIMLSLELLKLPSGNESDRTKILEVVRGSCSRGSNLVRQVLSFARGLEGQRVPVSLHTLIDDLIGIIGETFPRNITIVANVPAEVWPINGDPTQLHQVLFNLAVNARDAMPKGGILSLSATNIAIDAQYASTSRRPTIGRHVLIKVSDTGVGIPPEIRERIFEPFFTTKETGRGTGLGLATVNAVVKSHGGFISVDSEAGLGATFNIYFPADDSNREPDIPTTFEPEIARGQSELILVVDDESSIRLITQQTLEAFGYRVMTASDGAEAVAFYAKQPELISLVITDLMMPILDGAATILVLQRINPRVKIIAVSGLEPSQNLAKISSAGVHDFLPKPYTAQMLLRLVREIIDRPEIVPTSSTRSR